MEDINNGGNAVVTLDCSAKLLSICILSYNQADEIERLLNCLLPQYTEEIEIVVKDDSTNDETELLVNRFKKVLPIRYYRGAKEGIDKTIIFLTRKALGQFVWWMGDDTIEPGGVAAVVEVIKSKPSVNFIWANYQLFNTKLFGIELEVKECEILKDQLLVLAGAGLGFISSTIFNRNLGMKAIATTEEYVGTLFVNLYIVLYVISQPGGSYYLKGPIVICHPATSEEVKSNYVGNSGEINNPAFQTFGISFASIVNNFSDSFDPKIIRKTLKRSFGQTWRGVLVGTVGGWDTTKGKKLMLIRNFHMYPECWIALVLFMLPVNILKSLYRLYKSVHIRIN